MIHCYEFYASPVISKPRYFELFFHFPWEFQIAGFDGTNNLLGLEHAHFTVLAALHALLTHARRRRKRSAIPTRSLC